MSTVRSPMSLHARPPIVATRRASAGFTLLEIVLAVSILALGLGLAMRAATDSMRQAKQAAEYTEVALYAQNLLDSLGLEEPLEVGEYDGEFDDSGYRWRLSVTEAEPLAEMPANGPEFVAGIDLLELQLVVEWDRGERTREATFRSLRALTPDLRQ